ncbi:MAG: PilZ domain-containing protein [Proteobacteria bacterium]|nr:PilZ domain-containing protein [Pseudomonadota bacterium]
MRYTTDKRISPRLRRKLRVVFDHDPHLAAATIDLSRHGLCVASDFVAPQASEVSATLVLPDGQRIPFSGLVRWIRKVRGESTLGGTNRMGIRFAAPLGGAYADFIDQTLGLSGPAIDELASVPTMPGTAEEAPAQVTFSPAVTAAEVAELEWPVPPLGQVERMMATVQLGDLATNSEKHPAGLALGRAAQWIDEAASRCLMALLPPGLHSAGVGLSLTLTHRPPLAVGARIKVEVKVTRVTARGRTISLEARISEGARELASGQLARIVVEPEG